LGTPVVGALLVICTTEFSTFLNIVLRDNGLEELLLWEDEVLKFICCCPATTAVDGSITTLNGIVIIIIDMANTMAVANANGFLIGVTRGLFVKFIPMHVYKFTQLDGGGGGVKLSGRIHI
jgi:hypothetical protein